MKDFLDSLRQQIGDRISSPIFGSFAIAWLIWNHAYLVVLFSDVDAHYRLQLAKQLAYPTAMELWMRTLVYPIASSLGYILLYPWISRVLLSYWDRRQTDLNNRRIAIQGKAVMTEEMRDALLQRVARERAEFRASIRQLEEELETLRKVRPPERDSDALIKEIAELSDKLAEAERAAASGKSTEKPDARPSIPVDLKKRVADLSDKDWEALSHLVHSVADTPAGSVTESMLVNTSQYSNSIARAYLSMAVGLGLLRQLSPEGEERTYEATENGYQFLLLTRAPRP